MVINKIRTAESWNSSRTINKSKSYLDNGDYERKQSKRVNPRLFKSSSMIFDHVVSKSVDTERKITGCSRQHFKSKNLLKLHYKDEELETVQKLWQTKKKDYGILRNFMIKGSIDEYYHKNHENNSKTQNTKIKQDFWSSIGNMPGNSLGKRKNFKKELPKVTRK